MTDHVYKVVELVGSSPEGIPKAVEAAFEKAAASLRNLRWFEVIETRGQSKTARFAAIRSLLRWALPWKTLDVGLPQTSSLIAKASIVFSLPRCRGG